MSINRGVADVGESIDVFGFAPRPVALDPLDAHLRCHVEKFESRVSARQRVIIVHRAAAQHFSVYRAHCRQLWVILGVVQVSFVGLESLGKAGIIEAVFEKIRDGLDLVVAQSQTARRP